MPITVRDVRAFKERGERFPMLTAYDASQARLLDEAGIPLLLVGDTLGMEVLGFPSTVPVTLDDMLHHTAAVARGARNALVIGDMPFMTYQVSVEEGVRNAGRFLKQAGAGAVKLEGGAPVVDLVRRLVAVGVPVMGHVGLTPQSVNQLGGWRVQGRSHEQAERILADAKALEAAGAFAIVLEAVPAALAREITQTLTVPTIGIGAGPHCDGQVLVFHDVFGMSEFSARFVKRYAQVGDSVRAGAARFAEDVRAGRYPGPEHSYD
ncbi:MAG TPA: 3-methyl-2-oxobutanoate hydroxymethyltransferase [Actinomycetota bacterium]|nr:3-methyl-2-oxobutanoate hydroxymethyltransferase [Actinomycetota bacterium]